MIIVLIKLQNICSSEFFFSSFSNEATVKLEYRFFSFKNRTLFFIHRRLYIIDIYYDVE